MKVFVRGGFSWWKKQIGIYLTDGIRESEIAAILDTLPRTLVHQWVTVSEFRNIVTSRHGLKLVPELPIRESPPLDWIFTSQPNLPEIVDRSERHGTRTYRFSPALWPFQSALNWLSDTEGYSVSSWVGTLIEWPSDLLGPESRTNQKGHPELLFRLFTIGLLGMTMAWFFIRRTERGESMVKSPLKSQVNRKNEVRP